MDNWIEETLQKAVDKFRRSVVLARKQDVIPYKSEGGRWVGAPFDGNSWWTGGFWPGLMWQLYRFSGEEAFREEALRVERLLVAELLRFEWLNHDVGFMYLLSCGAHHRLTGDEEARRHTLHAANLLADSLANAGVKNVKVYDVSSTHVSDLIAEIFRCSHIVLAAPTYNNGIYPAMANLLHDMAALQLRNRTVGIVENGTWNPASGKLMRAQLEALKDMTILEPTVTLKSSLKAESKAQLEALKDAIVASL